MSKVYKLAKEFKNKYPFTIAWRLGQHAKVIDKYLDNEEEVLYVFLGQKNRSSFDFFNTNIIVLTNKRIMVATKRLAFGYFFTSITPDMFNDLTVKENLIWGRVAIDTLDEEIELSNISKKSLPEIENRLTEYLSIVGNDKKEKPKNKKRG